MKKKKKKKKKRKEMERMREILLGSVGGGNQGHSTFCFVFRFGFVVVPPTSPTFPTFLIFFDPYFLVGEGEMGEEGTREGMRGRNKREKMRKRKEKRNEREKKNERERSEGSEKWERFISFKHKGSEC